jgi:hypothetical protein
MQWVFMSTWWWWYRPVPREPTPGSTVRLVDYARKLVLEGFQPDRLVLSTWPLPAFRRNPTPRFRTKTHSGDGCRWIMALWFHWYSTCEAHRSDV